MKYKTVPSRPNNGSVSTNFPNFANKLSDVKIPKWIVKVLISSAILQFPSVLPFSSAFPEIFVSYFWIVIVKRENATRQNRARQKEWDFRSEKNILFVLYNIVEVDYQWDSSRSNTQLLNKRSMKVTSWIEDKTFLWPCEKFTLVNFHCLWFFYDKYPVRRKDACSPNARKLSDIVVEGLTVPSLARTRSCSLVGSGRCCLKPRWSQTY